MPDPMLLLMGQLRVLCALVVDRAYGFPGRPVLEALARRYPRSR